MTDSDLPADSAPLPPLPDHHPVGAEHDRLVDPASESSGAIDISEVFAAADTLPFLMRLRLSILWCLEWAITGAILTYLPLYFSEKGFSQDQSGQLMAIGAVGLWLAPFAVGQICDRFMATERYLAYSHFLGGVMLLVLPVLTNLHIDGHVSFPWLIVAVGVYAAAYFPTIPLASSLTFRHLPDPDRQFGGIRLWGTVGWVLAGVALSCWLGRDQVYRWLTLHLPGTTPTIDFFVGYLWWLPRPDSSDCFTIASLLSFLLAWFSWKHLPHTPPAQSGSGVAAVKVFGLFRDPTFCLLIGISFLLSIVVTFYSLEAPRLLEQIGVQAHWVPAVMTVGQISEFPALILLPVFLSRFGLKWTFALGIIAWLVRYALFAFDPPLTVALFAVGLHGICHVCLVIVIQLYIDSRSGDDIKATAQNLFAFITMGLGLPLGFLLAGLFAQAVTASDTGEVNYLLFFGMPALLLAVLLFIFARFVKLGRAEPA